MNSNPPNAGPAAPFNGARVVAIGRAGAEMALALAASGVPGFSYAFIDADPAAVASLQVEEKVFVGARLTRGFGAGGDPDLARAAADEEVATLRTLFQGHQLVFLLAGLGGGAGTGITPVVARVARETGASVFAFVSIPFGCEGSRRQQQALGGLHRLKTVADGVLCLPNEKLLLLANDRTTLVDAFRAAREHIRDAVLCIWNLLTRPGLLSVSFADICAVLRGPNLESAFARVETSGPDRLEAALTELLSHPLLSGGDTLKRAESLLISYNAGADLGIAEIQRLTEELNGRAGGARLVVGATVDELAGDRLTVCVMASTRHLVMHDTAEEAAHRAPAPANPAVSPRREGPSAGAGSGSGERRFAPPPPELTPELTSQLLGQGMGGGKKGKKKPEQVPLPFEVITKGRFEKCEPTVRRGHNLDQPTYLRRGITLN